ncbi:MAG TPA: hypothetical protein VLF15_03970 [Pseudoxanthomonas sp.]|nr:hypothetical protein [Pseudoxanthomonas sp.]
MHGIPKSNDNNPADNRESDQQKSNTPDKHRNEDGIGKAPDQPEQIDDRDPDRDYPDSQDTRVDR